MANQWQMRASVAILAALALASCGSSTKTVTATVASPSASTTSSGSSATSTSTQSSSTASGPARCRAAGLALSFIGQQGATGHGEVGFALRNTSGTSCRTFGYPGVLFLDQAGGALPTVPTHTTHDFAGTAPKVPLIVAPGATVSFRLGVTHGINSSAGCTTARGLQVIPPDDTVTLRVTIPMGAYECRTVTVTPLQPGTTAYR